MGREFTRTRPISIRQYFPPACYTCTVPVRKKFPTVEYFFYGDTRSTKNSTRTTSLCYGSGIQRTVQYVSTLTTRTSVAMITCSVAAASLGRPAAAKICQNLC